MPVLQLPASRKGSKGKVQPPRADRLQMGSWTCVSSLLREKTHKDICVNSDTYMKPNLLLCIAMFLSGGLFGCSSLGTKTGTAVEDQPPVTLGYPE